MLVTSVWHVCTHQIAHTLLHVGLSACVGCLMTSTMRLVSLEHRRAPGAGAVSKPAASYSASNQCCRFPESVPGTPEHVPYYTGSRI